MHIKVVQRGFVLQNQRYILPDAQIDQSGAEIPLIPEAALLCRSLACAPNLPHFVRRMENQHIQHEMLRRLQKVEEDYFAENNGSGKDIILGAPFDEEEQE